MIHQTTLAGFGMMLLRASVAVETHSHKALERVAEHIEHDSKERIGHYQPAIGPFAAWSPLAQATVDDRTSKGFSPDEPLLRTGELRESIHKHVERHNAVVGSDSEVAVAQELGTEKIPPRSFLGAAAVASLPIVKAEFADAVVEAVHHAARGGI